MNKKAGDLMSRLKHLEETVSRLQALFVTLDQYVDATAEAVGKEAVNAKYREARRRDVDLGNAENEHELKEGVAAGYLVKTDKVEARGVVVISEVTETETYDRSFVFMGRQPPAERAVLVDRVVGDEFVAPGGSKVKVLEIYRTDYDKFVAWQKERAAAEKSAAVAEANRQAAAAGQEAAASQKAADAS